MVVKRWNDSQQDILQSYAINDQESSLIQKDEGEEGNDIKGYRLEGGDMITEETSVSYIDTEVQEDYIQKKSDLNSGN